LGASTKGWESETKKLHTGVVALVAAAIAVSLIGLAAPAAAAPAAGTVVSRETVAMTHGGWDPAVAEAHGFKIETVNGQTTSVPVTSEAKTLAAGWAAKKTALAVHPDNTVEGDCGSSTVTAILENTSTGKVKTWTSYMVYAPSDQQHWYVAETSIHGPLIHTFDFSGLNASTSWVGAPQTYTALLANQGGDVQVTLGSFAVLIDGDICYSGGPVDWF
jgi:hypothetical protein